MLFFLFVLLFSISPVLSTELFDYKSVLSLSQLILIRSSLYRSYDVAESFVRTQQIPAAKIAELYWGEYTKSFEFLVNKSQSILSTMISRLETEIEMLLTDPESLEDMMEVDIAPFINFLKNRPDILRTILKSRLFSELKTDLKRHVKKVHVLPISKRMQLLVHVRKWNTT